MMQYKLLMHRSAVWGFSISDTTDGIINGLNSAINKVERATQHCEVPPELGVNMFKKSNVFFVVMFLASFAWSTYLVTIVSEALATKSWPVVEGTVISSNALRIQHNQERYIIEVEYSYSVEKKLFVGNRVSNFNSMLDRADRDLQLKKYETSNKVNVYYNPQERSKAYLIVGVDYGIYLLLFACIAMVFFSAVNLRTLLKN